MGIFDRFVKQEVQGQSQEQVMFEEQLQQEMLQREMDLQHGYSGGQPLPPYAPIKMPPTLEHETMKLYLKPETPFDKEKLKGNDRYWIYDDNVCTAILTSNFTRTDQKRIEVILRQARDLEGCDNVENLIQTLQYEVWMIVIINKARSDMPDHIRERIVPSIGMSLQGEAYRGTGAERPKEGRALFGLLKGGNQ